MRRGPSRPSTTSCPTRWGLVALGSGDLRAYPLADGEHILGRDLDCDVVLDHHRVSRRHARLCIAASGEAFAIEDLGSRNGTRVGARLVPNEPCAVGPGDPFGIGPFTLTVVRGAAPPASSLSLDDAHAGVPSPALQAVARSSQNVVIRGAPGARKQAVAEVLHGLSGRAGRLVWIDCAAALPEELEVALFGSDERGAARPGALEAARDGTLVLEEVGALPAALQVRLLQAIESREAVRVGGTAPVPISARLVCMTHRDLHPSVEAGAFRLDLYYRLAGATLRIRPPRAAGRSGSHRTSRPPRTRR